MLRSDAIVVSNLTKKYCGNIALNRISFTVGKGRIVGLIGPNGAGKSSILKILTGLIPGTAGDVLVNGISIADDATKAKKHISFMPENNPLPAHLRVGEYLRFRAKLKGVAPKHIRANTEKVMRQCDLYYEARYRMIKSLSKGFRQRVGIADALLGNGDIVVLDEPTIGLDPHQILAVRNIIRSNKGNRTILISSHILSELENVCDDFIIINRGSIVASGTLESLKKSTQLDSMFSAKICGSKDKIMKLLNLCLKNNELLSFEELSDSSFLVKFSANTTEYRFFLRQISDDEELQLDSVGSIGCSLEGVFLYATRRCRDQDMTKN